MKKTYLEPDVEFVSLIPQDAITNDNADGDVSLENSGWDW